jgi:hypothetical protein
VIKDLFHQKYLKRVYWHGAGSRRVNFYTNVDAKIKPHLSIRGVNYSEKSVRIFLGLENPGNFPRDSGIFSPNLKGILGVFQLIFSKYKTLIFFRRTFSEIFCDI